MDFDKVKLIFLGDTHGFLNDFEKQKEVIERYKPDYVLYEQLNDLRLLSERDYELLLKQEKISDMTSTDEIRELILLCKTKKIKLIGIDFENFGLDGNLQKVVRGERKPSEQEIKSLEELQIKREKNQVKKIKEYLKLTNKPVLVIIGSWHLRKESILRKTFDNFLLIIPADKKGELLLGPPEDGFIKFSEYLNVKKD